MDALHSLIARLYPGASVVKVVPLGDDGGERTSTATRKGTGYGRPLKITLRERSGHVRCVVFHTQRADEHGHDRRADRVQEVVLAYDTFGRIPRHVAALEAGLVQSSGQLQPLTDGEPYLVTTWADGAVYADDLRRVATEGAAPRDERRVDVLVDYLVGLHQRPTSAPSVYTRAVRDLVGGGEGIFGIADDYPADTPAAPSTRLRAIEARCVDWRWRLRDRADRLRRIHGDFHPFNLVFTDDDQLSVLDASRGCAGDPVDDLTALAINFVFFAIDRPGAWRGGLRALWHRTWTRYVTASGDRELFDVAAPWLAWRTLVVASPRWYPDLSPAGRDALLGWIERVLDAPRFDPASADEVAS